MTEQINLQPSLLNIKPTVVEEPSVEELDGELRKIAEDVLDAAKYSITAVSADANTQVRPDTLEADFQVALKSVRAELRTTAQVKANDLVKAPISVRKMVFGRYGELPAQTVLNEGFSRINENLPALKVNQELLGFRAPRLSVPLSRLEATEQGLLIPRSSLSANLSNFDSLSAATEQTTNEAAILDLERFEQVWGKTYENDIFSQTDAPDELFEGQSATDKLGLYIRKIKCEDETNPEFIGDDEIALAGISVDEDGDVKRINERFIGGGFKDGKERNYSNWLYHWFSMREGKYWPKRYGISFILAEKDNGGLASFLNKLWKRIRDKVKEAIAKAIEAGGAAVGGIFGSPEIGAAIGKVIGKVVAWVIDKLVSWLINLFNDDIFRPYTAWVTVPSFNARWNYANGNWGSAWSSIRTVRFHGFGGRYRLDYQWRIYA